MLFYYKTSDSTIEISKLRNCIVLIKDNWDDWFTYETKSFMKYIDENGVAKDIGNLKIAMFEMGDEQRTASIPLKFNCLSSDFFSLGQSDYYYDNIKQIGDEIREEILTALNDIAYNLSLYEKVSNLPVTKISLMREVSSYTLKNQFHRIACGKARLTNYDIEYTYPKKENQEEVKLDFKVIPDSLPPTNIHVIIGRNNVGKTYLIKNIIKSAYRSDVTDNVGILRSSNNETGRLVNSRKQAFANILCISFSPFDDYSDVEEIVSKRRVMPFKYIGLSSENLHQSIIDSFRQSLSSCLNSKYKIDMMNRALNILETDPIFEKSNLKLFFEKKDYKNQKDEDDDVIAIFKKLSSGHQVIMLTLVQLVDCITERSLVILDEPENHLHPPLLSAFIRTLSDLLIDRNGAAIVATHSPVILQEVPKSCVWKINRSGMEVRADRLDIESFGATIGALTREVFGLEVSQSGFHKILIDEVLKGKEYQSIVNSFNNELGDEAKILLRTLILLRDKNETLK